MAISGNIYVYNKDGYVWVKAENCGDATTLSHNAFNSHQEALTLHGHDDHEAAAQQGSGQVDVVSGERLGVQPYSTNYQHGVPIPAGTPNNPSYGAYRLRLGMVYGTQHTGNPPVTLAPGKFLRVGFRYISYVPVEIPREGEVTVVPYHSMVFRQNNTSTEAQRGAPVQPKFGSSNATQDIASLMTAGKDGVIVRGEIRIVPKEHRDRPGELAGWELWFDNQAPQYDGRFRTGFTGTAVLFNPARPDGANGEKNAGLGLESMACPDGGYSAMQFIRANGDYGREQFGVVAVPGASVRVGVRGYSTGEMKLPSLAEGTTTLSLNRLNKASSVDNLEFFDKEALFLKLGEKKNRVRFFQGGACINDKLPEVIYRGADAFLRCDQPPPRVLVEYVEHQDDFPGGGWRIRVTNSMPASPDDPKVCGDKLGPLQLTATLKLKKGEVEGRDFTKMPVAKLTEPGQRAEWFLPLDTQLGTLTATVGTELVVGTRGMGWLGTIPLPPPGRGIDTDADADVRQRTWELWETQHERMRLYPDAD